VKTWAVNVPVLVRDLTEGEGRDPKEYGMAMRFEVKAESADQAVYILWTRLEPTCGEPGL